MHKGLPARRKDVKIVTSFESYPPARIGRVWYNLLVGGGSADGSTRKILPEVLATNYHCTLARHAAIAKKFGAVNMIIRNPGGCGVGDMEFEQWMLAWPTFEERLAKTFSFQAGCHAIVEALGVLPAVYLGMVNEKRPWSTFTSRTLRAAIMEVTKFIPQGCVVVVDGSGVGDSTSVSVLLHLQELGYRIGCEPWPVAGQLLSNMAQLLGVTASDYFRRWSKGEIADAPKMTSIKDVGERQLILVEETPEPRLAEVLGWLRMGLSVAVKPDESGLYQKHTAREMEWLAAQ
jgi:hypothetical protein